MLLHLPLQDIIKVQRVSKSFQAVIKGSSKIQRAVFFTPPADSVPSLLWTETSNLTSGHKHSMIVSIVFEATTGLFPSISRVELAMALDESSSWRHHSVSVPPCTQISYVGAFSRGVQTVSNKKGVTMGNVFDAVKQSMPVPGRAGMSQQCSRKSLKRWCDSILLPQWKIERAIILTGKDKV